MFSSVPDPFVEIIIRGPVKFVLSPFSLKKKISSDKCNKYLCADNEPTGLNVFFHINASLSPNLLLFLLLSMCLAVSHRLVL